MRRDVEAGERTSRYEGIDCVVTIAIVVFAAGVTNLKRRLVKSQPSLIAQSGADA